MSVYYNEIDPYAAQWLRNLIAAGHIAAGDVDERSIVDVHADDLRGYGQCHFFAGIGGWSFALKLAGWPDDRPVWTGSCPCQPLSAAGQRQGHADERHLWPAFHRLIAECAPATVLGEQVASKDGREWLAAIRADMEALGYACGAADLCAAGVGAPHIRQRLYWVADKSGAGLERATGTSIQGRVSRFTGHSEVGELADTSNARSQGWHGVPERPAECAARPCGLAGELGDPRPVNGHWRDADWLFCRDGKWRPVEPGTFPLAHGISNRVGRLRAYGNAIVAQAGAAFIRAFLDVEAM